jgi:hypothetical protein
MPPSLLAPRTETQVHTYTTRLDDGLTSKSDREGICFKCRNDQQATRCGQII